MDQFELSPTKFCDRIQYLSNVFTSSDILAYYLNQDKIDVAKWSNSVTLVEAPIGIDYTFFLDKNKEFNPKWLKAGIGNIYQNGTKEENEAKIMGRISQLKISNPELFQRHTGSDTL